MCNAGAFERKVLGITGNHKTWMELSGIFLLLCKLCIVTEKLNAAVNFTHLSLVNFMMVLLLFLLFWLPWSSIFLVLKDYCLYFWSYLVKYAIVTSFKHIICIVTFTQLSRIYFYVNFWSSVVWCCWLSIKESIQHVKIEWYIGMSVLYEYAIATYFACCHIFAHISQSVHIAYFSA